MNESQQSEVSIDVINRVFNRIQYRAMLLGVICGLILVSRVGGTNHVHAETTALPVGSAPQPLEFSHFPDTLHAVVWRNWQLVTPEKLAEVLGTTPENITEIATSMGLPQDGQPLADWKNRGYITIIRRNWHLLPYEQLLPLIEMTSEQLAEALREDDFLYIKLGSLKPNCPPVRYAPPSPEAREHAAKIKLIINQHFGKSLSHPWTEVPFQFVEELNQPLPNFEFTPAPGHYDHPRYVYSYFAPFGDPLLNPEVEPFSDGLLQRLSQSGVNGIWMHVTLRQISPPTADFPLLGEGHELRIRNLQQLADRAERCGIKLFLYMNEPRALPAALFGSNTEAQGVAGTDNYFAMCTSTETVNNWLRESLKFVFTSVPNLGGVFTITASENLTHCASHFQSGNCPHCRDRNPDEIIAKVNEAIADGVHAGNPDAKVICWDWGWRGHQDATEIVKLLPDDVWLMSVSEWNLPISRGGIESNVGEYSISAVGPGPRALQHWKTARERGLKVAAKVQFNNTWELSSVPYIPAMDLIARHSVNLKQAGVDGFQLCWSLGGYPSPNLRLASLNNDHPDADEEELLNLLAQERYGPGASLARQAWKKFSDAFAEFPYFIGVVYTAPQQLGPANLLYAKPTGYAATMVGIPYDDVTAWRGIYPADVFAKQFEIVAQGWREGLPLLKSAIELAPESDLNITQKEVMIAETVANHTASVANQVRFVELRTRILSGELSETEQLQVQAELSAILDAEIELARSQFHIMKTDSRIGFEATNQYYYVWQDLLEKALNCEQIRETLLPVQQSIETLTPEW